MLNQMSNLNQSIEFITPFNGRVLFFGRVSTGITTLWGC